ncbi:MAG: MFS transporter [Candidatus Promineifilaceae bacterium]|nr:MFS transporter [Candidatus Promineifilaceae bacterium]
MRPSRESSPRLAALRYRDFRLLWFGQLVSTVGSQMQLIAVNWHIFELLQGQSYRLTVLGQSLELGAEALGLGTLGLVRLLPIIAFALIGGMMADVVDRRRLMMASQLAAALFAGVLALITLSGEANVAAIYLLTAAGAAAQAFDNPARQSLVPNLVPAKHLTNAVSLNTLILQLGTIIGPAVAGVLVGAFDVGLVYALNGVSFLAVVLALALMRHRAGPAALGSGLSRATLLEGLRFTYQTRIIWSTMLLDFFATLFASARTMLPIVASDILGLGVQGYGVLATAQPVGALLAGLVLSWRRDIRRQGAVLLLSVAAYGAATALFGLATAFVLSYTLFGITGAGDTISTVIRNTIRQLNTPDRLRGRMTGVNMIFFMGGPQLGELEAGLVAALFGVSAAIVSGGLATVLLTAWVAYRYPTLRNYLMKPDQEAAFKEQP